MFEQITIETKTDQFSRHQIHVAGKAMSFRSVCAAWQNDPSFRSFYTQMLKGCPFEGYRWEMPAITELTADRIYEFVLVNSPGFCKRTTDSRTFGKRFRDADGETVIAFANLSGDAMMVVPTPNVPDADMEAYGHLAAFVRRAPSDQVDRMWQVIGETTLTRIAENPDRPIWLNTAGGGVAWLHVRLDSRPKYYHYAPFKSL